MAAWALAAAPARAQPLVIVLSWDGVRHDAPDLGVTPGLARMAREGARAQRLRPVFPANTFPNHVSIATGTYPDRHGIVDNVFVDRDRGRYSYEADASWLDAEPLWIAAERQGLRAAVFFWVASETKWRGRIATYRRQPFDSSLSERSKVDQILAWIDLPPDEAPALIMSWWRGTDHIAHRRGPDHPDVTRRLALQDRELSRLLAGIDQRGLWPRTTLVVLSDHGMTESGRAVDPTALVRDAGVEAKVVARRTVADLWLDDPEACAEVAERLRAEGLRAYAIDALPATLRIAYPARRGDVVLLADAPEVFRANLRGRPFWGRLHELFEDRGGGHGYGPEHPDMGAIFLAMGRGVPAGLALPALDNVDVAPTVAHWLGIDPPLHNEGVPVPGLSERLSE